jgi:hypothetical protein
MWTTVRRPNRVAAAEIETLVALCVQLEARLRAAQDTSASFATAAVHHLEA